MKKKVTTYIIDKFIDILLSPKTRMFLNPFIDITYRIYERYLFKQITSKSVPKHIEELNNLFDIIKKGLIELKDQGVLDKYRVRLKVFGKLSIVRKDVVDLAKELEALTSMYDNKFLNIAICYGGRQEILDAIKAIVKDAMLSKIDIDRLTEDILRNYLSTSHLPSPEPDLVIRTSGELRISNFLLWQIAYSELYFCDVYWPDFRKIDLYRAIRSYQSRERRYGR
ncbi:MAG: polyprenyl diphosphate synthase [Ignisphaera sp.]